MKITLMKDQTIQYQHDVAQVKIHENGDISVVESYPEYNEFVQLDFIKGKEFDYAEIGNKGE